MPSRLRAKEWRICLVERGGALFRRVGFIAANLIAFCRSKTVSKAVHAPPADGSCRKAGTVCVGVNLISADGTPGVAVSISVRVHSAIAVYTCRITRSIRVKDGALGVQRRNRYRQHQHCKDGACHRTPLLLCAVTRVPTVQIAAARADCEVVETEKPRRPLLANAAITDELEQGHAVIIASHRFAIEDA